MQHAATRLDDESVLFQSMHPIKDATYLEAPGMVITDISIHAPYKGCNDDHPRSNVNPSQFQSMHPIKDATCVFCNWGAHHTFQSMHPIKDATRVDCN